MMHHGLPLENDLFWSGLSGGYERVSLELWMKLCRDARVIMDVGANTGLYALLARALNPHAHIIAFEPVDRAHHRLVANIALNAFTIQVEKCAVSDHEGKAVMHDNAFDHAYTASLEARINPEGITARRYEVPMVSLDTFLEQHGVGPVDLMKIDVELHEPSVLRGFAKGMRAHPPALLIEVLRPDVAAELDALMQGSGYQFYQIDERGPVTRRDRIMASAGHGFNYLFCTPEQAARIGLKP